MKTNKGGLFIVSAPSGAGKTTLCRALMAAHPEIGFSVSYTTRPARQGEVDGSDYSFIDNAAFERMVRDGEFLEWAGVHGNYYGTSRRRVEAAIDEGRSIILDIDVQGARSIKNSLGWGVYIFILPPSIDALADRLRNRKSNSPEDMRRRIEAAQEEISNFSWYDYVIINDDLKQALGEFEAVVTAAGLGPSRLDGTWVRERFFRTAWRIDRIDQTD